jgi:hypothetical protein
MKPKAFPQYSSRPAACHCIANSAGGYYSQARRDPGLCDAPIRNQAAAHQSLAFLPYAAELTTFLDPQSTTESQPGWRVRPHAALNWRQTLASHPAAISQDGAPALRGIAAQKTMLPLPPPFRRLILSFHKSTKVTSDNLFVQNGRWGSAIGARENNSRTARVKPYWSLCSAVLPLWVRTLDGRI